MRQELAIDTAAALASLRAGADTKPAPGTREMLIRIGANVILFNQIELAFKSFLRHAEPIDVKFDLDPLASILKNLETQPLGNVAKLLTRIFDPEKKLGFAAYLKAVTDSRNQLIHHFLQIPGVSLVEGGPVAAVKWLKDQHDFCLPLKTMAEELSVGVLYAQERMAAENGEVLVVEEWRDHWQ